MEIKNLDEFNSQNQKQLTPFEKEMLEVISSFGFNEKNKEILDLVNEWWKKNEKDYDKENDDPDDMVSILMNEVLQNLNDDSEDFEDMCFHIAQILLEQN